MTWHNNILCVYSSELLRSEDNSNGLLPKGTYDYNVSTGKFKLVRRAALNTPALIEYETLPPTIKAAIAAKYGGDVYEYVAKSPIISLIQPDFKAKKFFQYYKKPSGEGLDEKKIASYCNDAAILNALSTLLNDKKALKNTLKITLNKFWATACTIVSDVQRRFPNNLPTSERRLKPLYNEYKQQGYAALLDKRDLLTGNNKKADSNVEMLILALYVRNKCFAKEVYADYLRFLNGAIQIVDVTTGEMYQPEQFSKHGQPLKLSQSTIWRIINKPSNRPVIDKLRLSQLDYARKHRPHMHRHAPVYSFSKITMDDINLPFKMPDNKRAWAYQIFDVASGCVIGYSFARSNDEGSGKNKKLFADAIINMFRLLAANGWGTPLQIEVEQHISNTFADDLLQAGNTFPFVRFCRGGNPQEKRAENFINAKKYGYQHQRQGFQARHYAQLEARRLNQDRDKTRYQFEEIVANELADIQEYNHSEHPSHPGKTRWQVLEENINPDIPAPNLAQLALYIGESSPCTLYNNQYVKVKGRKYWLPDGTAYQAFGLGDIRAHYIPTPDGSIDLVHLYQVGKLIHTATQIPLYNEAMAERTDHDTHIMGQQFGFRKQFDSDIKDRVNALPKVLVMQNRPPQTTPNMVNKKQENEPEKDFEIPETEPVDWARKAYEDI